MPNLQRYLLIVGLTVLIGFVASVQVLSHSPFDSAIRGAARGAVTAAGFLEIVWLTVAAFFAAVQWRVTTWPFRIILSLNSVIAVLLVREFFR